MINKIISGLLFTCVTFYPTSDISNIESLYPISNIASNTIISEGMKVAFDVNKENIEKQKIVSIKLLSDEELNLISRVTMAEAEDEPWEGKRYVIDTILNRVDSKHFPNTVKGVIYQKGQFTSMWNGRYNRCASNSKLNDMINYEYNNRTNSNVVFFTADHYGEYGRPSFRVGNHYFSNYK